MTVGKLIELLHKMDPAKTIATQVAAEDGSVWNCWVEVHDIPNSNLVQLKVLHSELKTLVGVKTI